MLKAKEIGPGEAAKVVVDEFTKPDPKRLAEVHKLKPEAFADAENAKGTNPTLEQLNLTGAAGQ